MLVQHRLQEQLKGYVQQPTDRRGLPVDLNKEPVEAIASLLDDIDEGSRSRGAKPVAETSLVDTQQLAAMSITFEVVNKV